MRRWHWRIDELEQGPDYVFMMEFMRADSMRLRELVEQHLPAQYVRNDLEPKPPRYANARSYSSYLDTDTYQKLRAIHASGIRQSIWFHGQIDVVDHVLHIRHVLAGGMYDETELISVLTRAPELTLVYWHVAYAGYEWGDVASGRSTKELFEYLKGGEY